MRVGTEDEMAEETIEVPYERDDMFREQHAMFLECIAGDRAPETTAAAGLLVQQMIELSTESWQQGKPLEFPTAAAAAPPGKL
jgi:predicted dehydrogenase